jgi:hypothetical protein
MLRLIHTLSLAVVFCTGCAPRVRLTAPYRVTFRVPWTSLIRLCDSGGDLVESEAEKDVCTSAADYIPEAHATITAGRSK